jgi:hypothetical protein
LAKFEFGKTEILFDLSGKTPAEWRGGDGVPVGVAIFPEAHACLPIMLPPRSIG